MLEKQIQSAILDWLRWHHVFCWKQNTVGIRKPNGSYIPASTTGIPDILCIIKGQFVGIEVKSEKGIQTDNQKHFQNEVERAGGIYILAKSIDDVQNVLHLS